MSRAEEKLDFLIRLVVSIPGIPSDVKLAAAELLQEAEPADRNQDIDRTITALLRKVGVPGHLNGYLYLKEAITIVVQDSNMLRRRRGLYDKVAEKFGTTGGKVERCIRHGVELSAERCDLDVMDEIFGSTMSADKGKPTNSEFIAAMATAVREQI